MARALLKFRVVRKVALSAGIFGIPIMFILWSLVATQNVAVQFPAKEILGARYLGAVPPLKSQPALATLTGTAVPDKLRGALAMPAVASLWSRPRCGPSRSVEPKRPRTLRV